MVLQLNATKGEASVKKEIEITGFANIKRYINSFLLLFSSTAVPNTPLLANQIFPIEDVSTTFLEFLGLKFVTKEQYNNVVKPELDKIETLLKGPLKTLIDKYYMDHPELTTPVNIEDAVQGKNYIFERTSETSGKLIIVLEFLGKEYTISKNISDFSPSSGPTTMILNKSL